METKWVGNSGSGSKAGGGLGMARVMQKCAIYVGASFAVNE